MRSNITSALLGCIAALALSTSPASAAPAAPAQATSAMVRGAHFSPDTPAVDIYLTDLSDGTTTKALSHVGYGDVSDYQRIQPGRYTVDIRPAGTDLATPVTFSLTLDAQPGSAFTALAIGMHDSLEGRVLSDDLTPPPAGWARMRVIQAADRAQLVGITADSGLVPPAQLPFATITGYLTVAAGSWPVTTSSVDDPDITTTTNVALKAGGANTVIVLDGLDPGSIWMRVVDDAIDLPRSGLASTGGGGRSPCRPSMQPHDR
jgi:hypothetical protein